MAGIGAKDYAESQVFPLMILMRHIIYDYGDGDGYDAILLRFKDDYSYSVDSSWAKPKEYGSWYTNVSLPLLPLSLSM